MAVRAPVLFSAPRSLARPSYSSRTVSSRSITRSTLVATRGYSLFGGNAPVAPPPPVAPPVAPSVDAEEEIPQITFTEEDLAAEKEFNQITSEILAIPDLRKRIAKLIELAEAEPEEEAISDEDYESLQELIHSPIIDVIGARKYGVIQATTDKAFDTSNFDFATGPAGFGLLSLRDAFLKQRAFQPETQWYQLNEELYRRKLELEIKKTTVASEAEEVKLTNEQDALDAEYASKTDAVLAQFLAKEDVSPSRKEEVAAFRARVSGKKAVKDPRVKIPASWAGKVAKSEERTAATLNEVRANFAKQLEDIKNFREEIKPQFENIKL